MNYIRKHWRGELSLSVSFWVNVFLLNIAILLFENLLTQNTIIEHPQVDARVTLIFISIALLVVYPWQLIGLWRSCNHHVEKTGKGYWARSAQVLIVLGLLAIVSKVNLSWPIYKDLYHLGFEQDEYANYTLELEKNNTVIHLTGVLGFGVSKDVANLLNKYPDVTGIILDSPGGRLYESRELAKLILTNGLDAYSLTGCYSACATAFIAGKQRYLALGANLAFHQYRSPYNNLGSFAEIKKEQEKDLRIFRQQGVKKEFLDKLFATTSDDLWYPTTDELIEAKVVHKVVRVSDISGRNRQRNTKK